MTDDQRNFSALTFEEGDRCNECHYWYWRDGHWHSLVPITYADTPELARWVPWCGRCNPAEAI